MLPNGVRSAEGRASTIPCYVGREQTVDYLCGRGKSRLRRQKVGHGTPGTDKHDVMSRAVIPKGNTASFGFASEKLEPCKNGNWVWRRTVVATWLWLRHYGRQSTVALGEKKEWVCGCNRDKDAV